MCVRSFSGSFVTLSLSQMSIDNSSIFVEQSYPNTPLLRRRRDRQTRLHVFNNLERGAADWYGLDGRLLGYRRCRRLYLRCRFLWRARGRTGGFLTIAGRGQGSTTIRLWL